MPSISAVPAVALQPARGESAEQATIDEHASTEACVSTFSYRTPVLLTLVQNPSQTGAR